LENGENNESVNTVKDVPDAFKQWVSDNSDRLNKAGAKGSVPYFIKDNKETVERIRTEKKEKNGQGFTAHGTKHGRTATRKALKEYEDESNVKHVRYSPEQIENHKQIESILGIKKGNDMSFEDADGGMANIDLHKDEQYTKNCQCCIVANELRRRGFDVTALGYNNDKDSVPYRLGEDLSLAFLNKKGNVVTMTEVKNNEIAVRKAIPTSGRYIIGYDNIRNEGHAICAERLLNGKIIFFDPQSGEAVKLDYDSLKEIQVLRVDNLIFNKDIIASIVRESD